MSPVLDGIRVLDFSRYIAAPTVCALLADAGAEVVRVEAPGGEEDRRIGVMGPQDQPMWFACTGRHKRGITLDLRNEAASPLLRDLVRLADVIVHNYAPAPRRPPSSTTTRSATLTLRSSSAPSPPTARRGRSLRRPASTSPCRRRPE